MKSEKELEGKQMEPPPLFPRIRLTNAEKGWPKAPPRNKMSISSPNFAPSASSSSSSSSSFSLSSASSCLVPSTSYNHDSSSSYKRSIFSSYHSIPGSMYLAARRSNSHNSDGINLNASLTIVKPEAESTNHQKICHRGGDGQSLVPLSITNSKSTSVKKLVNKDDFKVPSFSETSNFREAKMELEKITSSSTRKRSAFAMKELSLSRSSHEASHLNLTKNDHEDPDCGSARDGSEKNRDFKKKTSNEISPDAVIRLIGQKRFLKARRTLEQQQRVFASQVFELHRLIKVQKELAASPELFLEDNFKLKAAESMKSLVTKPDTDQIPRKPAIENATKRIPYAHSNDKPISLVYPSLSTIPTDPSSWCLSPPPGNQWLVPIRSPSEGLVYKPYTGPYPPSVGLLAPIISGPINLTHHAFSIPEANGIGPISPTYISPYVLPMIKPSSHISHINQTFPLVKAPSNNSSYTVPYKTSSRKGVILGSSSSDRGAHVGDELPLFPTEPTPPEGSGNKSSGDECVKVIKVVPHNPKLASESAARIFRSIQEEKNQGARCTID